MVHSTVHTSKKELSSSFVPGFWDKNTTACAGAMPFRRYFPTSTRILRFQAKLCHFILAWLSHHLLRTIFRTLLLHAPELLRDHPHGRPFFGLMRPGLPHQGNIPKHAPQQKVHSRTPRNCNEHAMGTAHRPIRPADTSVF